jgi:3-deoxy-manno-octulosonate cytidylyltransferase (CMP-KDO synthetase)
VPTPEISKSGADDESRLVVGAIPARYASTRLPGKPLRRLAGRTLIEHVYRRAEMASQLDRVVVLTDDERIMGEVSRFGGTAQMTPAECASGTDRIAAVAHAWDAAAVVNIQGDEPLIEPEAIDRLARHLKNHPDDPIVTLATSASIEDFTNPDAVKVVVDLEGIALYFSRAAIPFSRNAARAPGFRHIGIYGYQLTALLRLASLPPGSLEQSESLEQLRALENGMRIRVLQVEHSWQGVDTMEDLVRVEALLNQANATET